MEPVDPPFLSVETSSSLLHHRSSTVILLSLSREESNLVFVRDLPWDELSGVITPVSPWLVRGIGSPMPARNRRQWAREGPGAR